MKKKQENIDETLLLRIIENRADDMEISYFNKWHDNSVENAEFFAQFTKAYQLSSFDKHSTQANWSKVVNKFNTGYTVPDFIELPEPGVAGRKIRLNSLLRVAAVIVLVFGLTFLLKITVFSPEQLIVSGYDLKNNEPYQLEDGSLVYLNGNSEISFPKNFGSKNREVILKGEAFFEVVKDKKMPFQITANRTTTRVLGTSFNVSSELSGKVKVSVVTGVVEFFTNKRNIVELRAGEQGTYYPATTGIEKDIIDDPNFQAWKTGVLVFRDTPLKNVLDLLSQHYGKTLVFDEDGIIMPEITTTFNNQPLEAVLEELNLLLNTKNDVENDTIIFKPAS